MAKRRRLLDYIKKVDEKHYQDLIKRPEIRRQSVRNKEYERRPSGPPYYLPG